MKQTIQFIKNATIFIAQKQVHMVEGKSVKKEKAIGTGCLISIEGILHFITARHVLMDKKT